MVFQPIRYTLNILPGDFMHVNTASDAEFRSVEEELDQSVFVVDAASYEDFTAQLEAPAQNQEGRERLMATKPEWSGDHECG
ncbi:hypothetical protein UP00_21145 [Enterobacter asburiae]|nr:hypothetical protein NI40_001620 [Enterobacter sp. E20]KJI58374.1 hypothetical protein UP00_21145 [Enterobacter asburiae]KJW77072.1 hypothetical protein SG67_21915 [Enterobacter asburiae]KJX03952.1 hypothetical protein SG66_22815 [Enterobacter asburiae]